MTESPRQQLEHAILGAALCDRNVLHQIISVVNHKNFSDQSVQKCWTVIEKMYPNTPVDLVTFTLSAKSLYPNEWQLLLMSANTATNMIASTAHTYHHAFTLLEIDIADKLYKTLYEIRNTYPLSSKETESIMMHLSGKTADVFTVLEKALEYYQAKEMEGEHETLKDFEGGLLKRIEQIKQMAQVDLALEILTGVSQLPDQNIQLTRLLKNGIIALCMSNELPANFTKDVTSLTNQ